MVLHDHSAQAHMAMVDGFVEVEERAGRVDPWQGVGGGNPKFMYANYRVRQAKEQS